MQKPLFILSLPRSGSTLLQRMLTASPEVSSASEPWLLLPLVYTLKKDGQFSEYWHGRSFEAGQDFLSSFENGEDHYRKGLNRFITNIYSEASDQTATYFLDKTPRYHLIVDELLKIFPDAKFILLLRNPIGVAASIIETWGNGRWKLDSYKIDLYRGLNNLVDAYENHSERMHKVNYEDLLVSPEATMKSITEYLGIEYKPEMLTAFQGVKFSGRMGDPTGVVDYTSLSDKPLHKWKQTMANPIRRRWSKGYLEWLGDQRLETMGYNRQEMLDELADSPLDLKTMPMDIVLRCYGIFYALFEPALLHYKLKKLRSWEDMVSHR